MHFPELLGGVETQTQVNKFLVIRFPGNIVVKWAIDICTTGLHSYESLGVMQPLAECISHIFMHSTADSVRIISDK